MTRRLSALALIAACALMAPAPAAPPAVTIHPDVPAALKEAKTLGVPAFVVLAKTKAAIPPAFTDPRVARAARAFACAAAPLTPTLAKQYDLAGDAYALVLDPDGAVVEKFEADLTAEKLIAGVRRRAAEARAEALKSLRPDSDAKAKKAALTALVRLGPPPEHLIPLLNDPDAMVKAAAKKALTDLTSDATMTALLDALKSDDVATRVAVHPLAVQATGYKKAPLAVWQGGTAEERAAAWDKWNEHVQTQFPPLNRAVLAYAEFSLGAQVADGECSSLASEAFKECGARPWARGGETVVWGRALKPGEPVLPGDVVQYEGARFGNGITAPHHTAVVRRVLAPGKCETLEQNVNGVKKVQPGKLDMAALKEGTVVIYRPQPK